MLFKSREGKEGRVTDWHIVVVVERAVVPVDRRCKKTINTLTAHRKNRCNRSDDSHLAPVLLLLILIIIIDAFAL